MLRIHSRISKGNQTIKFQISLKHITFYRYDNLVKSLSSTQKKYICESIPGFRD